METLLKSIYYDPRHPASFGGAIALYRAAKAANPYVSLSDIKDWLSSQLTYTLHKPVRRKFLRNKILVTRCDEEWMADLTDFTNESRFNNGYKYVLCVIDVFSKFGWAVPLKNKTPATVVKAF